jgi:cell fate regulator YaaT (PSP1 superfamily)
MVADTSVWDIKKMLCGGGGFSATGCNPGGRGSTGSEKGPSTAAVRYGLMGYIGEFRYGSGALTRCGSRVVIQTNRGIEIGDQVSLTCSNCERAISRQQMVAYAKNSGADAYQLKAGRILRVATEQDLEEEARINRDTEVKLTRAKEAVAAHGLPMKFIGCEHLFGGERIIFHFMAESRVDFRELVRDLAHEYHTRIEMHQVGARDEARLLADYEICGRECCCKNFLKKLRPVTMRMAKLQKATLDPSKVSGRCGRLRCCLRYEHDGYEDLNRKLPRVGTRVRTQQGVGVVKDRHVLTQFLTIIYENEQVETLALEEVLEHGPEVKASPEPPERQREAPVRDRGKAAVAPRARPARAREERQAAEPREEPPSDSARAGKRRRSSRRRSRPATVDGSSAPDGGVGTPREGTDPQPKVADGHSAADGQPTEAADVAPGSSQDADAQRVTGDPPGRRRGRRGRRRPRRNQPVEDGGSGNARPRETDGPKDGRDAPPPAGGDPPASTDGQRD